MTSLSLLAVLTTGAGAALIRLGLAHKALELRKPRRPCPACGRMRDGRTCRACAGGHR